MAINSEIADGLTEMEADFHGAAFCKITA